MQFKEMSSGYAGSKWMADAWNAEQSDVGGVARESICTCQAPPQLQWLQALSFTHGGQHVRYESWFLSELRPEPDTRG